MYLLSRASVDCIRPYCIFNACRRLPTQTTQHPNYISAQIRYGHEVLPTIYPSLPCQTPWVFRVIRKCIMGVLIGKGISAFKFTVLKSGYRHQRNILGFWGGTLKFDRQNYIWPFCLCWDVFFFDARTDFVARTT